MEFEELEKRLAVLEKKIRVIEEIKEIEQLHYRYINNLCFAQYDKLVGLLAENSTIDFPPLITGKKKIVRHFKENISTRHFGKEHDLLVHPIIKIVDSNKATGHWLLYMKSDTFPTWLQRVYETEYIKEDGVWKFSYLYTRARLGWPENLPPDGQLPEDWNGSKWG